jgi:GTP cyclohydrolase II
LVEKLGLVVYLRNTGTVHRLGFELGVHFLSELGLNYSIELGVHFYRVRFQILSELGVNFKFYRVKFSVLSS